jgi:hypothetical protein
MWNGIADVLLACGVGGLMLAFAAAVLWSWGYDWFKK